MTRFVTTIQHPGVFTAPTDLPDDPAMLQAILRAALAEIERLQLQIAGLQRNRFGRRSERLDDAAWSKGSRTWNSPWPIGWPGWRRRCRRRRSQGHRRSASSRTGKRNRGALPAHLPRVEVVVDIDDKACPCCGGSLHQIGEDRAEMLDYVPAQLRVRVIRRPRYGCRACEAAVVQGASTGSSDRRRHGDRGAAGAGADRQI